MSAKSRIAYFEPVKLGLDVYGRELLPHLAEYFDVDIYVDDVQSESAQELAGLCAIYPFAMYGRRKAAYAHTLLHIRNNPAHAPIYDVLVTFGGVSVFHDVNISGIVASRTLAQGKRLAFLNAILRNEGWAAFVASTYRFLVHRKWPNDTQYMLNRVAQRRSHAIIVHNEQAKASLTCGITRKPVALIRPGAPRIAGANPLAARTRLGLSADDFVIVSLGIIAERKRIPQALEAFARFATRVPNARYLLVGESDPRFDVRQIICRHGLNDKVTVTGWVADEVFRDYVTACDLCINLRFPVEGETSFTALQAMSSGKPTLVSNAGSMRELPDDSCVKIPPGYGETEAIVDALCHLYDSPPHRAAIGERASEFIHRRHAWSEAAKEYSAFLEALAAKTLL